MTHEILDCFQKSHVKRLIRVLLQYVQQNFNMINNMFIKVVMILGEIQIRGKICVRDFFLT